MLSEFNFVGVLNVNVPLVRLPLGRNELLAV